MVIKKHPLQSKTLIVNVISLIAILIQAQTGFIIDMEIQGSILAIANTVKAEEIAGFQVTGIMTTVEWMECETLLGNF